MQYKILLAFLAVPLCAPAQWLKYADPGIPRTKDGKPNMSAPAPHLRGKPDLSGIWEPESTPRKVLASLFPPGVGLLPGGENGLGEIDPQKYFLNFLADFKPGEETLELALMKESEVPWKDIAFRTVGLTLKHYFADRARGVFGFHAGDIPPI